MWLFTVLTPFFLCVFVEEVILADDENENDYDGMNLVFCPVFLCMHGCLFIFSKMQIN